MAARPAFNISIVVKFLVIVVWITFFGLLLKRDYLVESLEIKQVQALKRSNQESFLGVYFKDQRIGYVRNRFLHTESGDVDLEQDAFLLLNILDKQHPVKLSGTARLSSKYLLKEFSFRFKAPFSLMEVQGVVQGDTIELTVDTGKDLITDRIKLKNPPFLSTNRRAYLLGEGLKPGDKVRVPYFDPFTLTVHSSVVEYRGRDKELIKGRIYNLHKFIENYSGIKVSSWLNDKGDVVKEESPAGFIFIAEPEFKATDVSRQGAEVLSTVSVPLEGPMVDLAKRQRIVYQLGYPEDGDFSLDKDRQSLVGNLLTLEQEIMPANDALVCSGQESELQATPYIQANDQRIGTVVASLDLAEASATDKMRALSGWVFENLEKKPVIGIPDAVTTLVSGRGDCNEHAALFAALARNSGLPARIVAGVTLMEGAFYYHAWNEVCIDQRWITLDTTKNQIPADLGHIKFVEGETGEQVKIGALLGNLRIEVVE